MLVTDDMTEERWADVAPQIGDGWLPGRVPCAGGGHGPAFGWTKGNFGIFEAITESNVGQVQLSSLTHLKSGMHVGLFSMPDAAATAAMLAESVGDWSEIDESGITNESWRQRANRMYALWQSAGMQYGPLVIFPSGKTVWCATEQVGARQ